MAKKVGTFDWLKSQVRGFATIKLPGGVVGKLSMVMIAVVFSAATIAWSVRNEWIAVAALVVVAVIVLSLGHRLINFAEKHPQTALMEGAELLVHEQIQQVGMKSRPTIPVNIHDLTDENPQLPAGDRPLIASSPDSPDEGA